MSRWWPEQLQIVLHPRQVQLLRMSRSLTPRVLDKSVISCPPVQIGEPLWNSALQTLGNALQEFLHGRARASVVLSNHFVRYGIFQNSENITRTEEELALVQHQFSRIYGQSALHWIVSLSQVERFDIPRVACAVDQGLMNGLRDLCLQQQTFLQSVQPYLTVAFNQFSSQLHPNTWLTLVEDGILCLAHLQNGRWQSIKTARINSDWRRELTRLIQRETLLAGLSESNTAQSCPVMVIAPEYPAPVDISKACNSEQYDDADSGIILDPSLWPEPAHDSGTVQAMAVCA